MTPFTPEILQLIQETLEHELPPGEMKCLSKSKLFGFLEHQLPEMERYYFENCVGAAIRDQLIVGFETRSGKNGGICRIGVFDGHDTRRKRECVVTVRGVAYHVSATEAQVFGFITCALDAQPTTDPANAIYINNAAYRLGKMSAEDVLLNYLRNKHKAELVEENNDNAADTGS